MFQIDTPRHSLLASILCSTAIEATYLTKDGRSLFRFSFIQVLEHYEIDILEQPPYLGKPFDLQTTHRCLSARGCKMIEIIHGNEPTSLEAAKLIARQWAEMTNTYIQTGESFEEQLSR